MEAQRAKREEDRIQRLEQEEVSKPTSKLNSILPSIMAKFLVIEVSIFETVKKRGNVLVSVN